MASSFGIDGLASGLDTTGIINQLISIEQQPIVRLEQRISRNDAAINSLQTFSTAFDNIKSLAEALSGDADTFLPVVASSSHDTVVATASEGADQGSFTFTVNQLASTHRVVSGGTTADPSDIVATADSTVRITVDGTDYDVDTGDGALSTLITNINNTAGLGVKAQAVNTGSGYKLQLAATESGADAVFTVDDSNLTAGFASGMPVLTQGLDAQVTIGDGPGAYTVSSASNTFTDVIAGVTFTVTEADPTEQITVSVEADPDTLVDQVSELVNAINTMLTDMSQALDSGSDGSQGTLSNDPTMRSLRDSLVNAVTYAVGGTHYQSAGLIGINSTREGGLEFDETAFRAALTERPDDVTAMFRSDDVDNPGLAQRIEALAEEATAFNTGTFATAIESRETHNSDMQHQID